ncbi:hypothetical protein HPG69_002575, partial [Diceros bicornis minor]
SKALPRYPERGPYSVVLSSHHNLKGRFHNVWSTGCSANEGGGCPQIPCSRNLLRWHQILTPYTKRKVMRICKELLLAAHTITTVENPAGVSVISSRNTGQGAVL